MSAMETTMNIIIKKRYNHICSWFPSERQAGVQDKGDLQSEYNSMGLGIHPDTQELGAYT